MGPGGGSSSFSAYTSDVTAGHPGWGQLCSVCCERGKVGKGGGDGEGMDSHSNEFFLGGGQECFWSEAKSGEGMCFSSVEPRCVHTERENRAVAVCEPP